MRHWVYFLLKGKRLVYVGCTKDYNTRINKHKLNGLKFDSFRVIECVDYETAAKYEKRWIFRFKPKYNQQNNPAFDGRLKSIHPKKSKIKEMVSIRVKKDRAKRLREFAVKEQKIISIVVENALEQTYGI